MSDEWQIAALVAEELKKSGFIEVEASARHVHLCQEDVEKLFGKGAGLTQKRALSQKGEFLCEQRVTIVTGRRTMNNVAVLGPIRPRSQVELSLTDGISLGLKLPVRDSGDVDGTPGILLQTDFGQTMLACGCICAGRHLHATPEDARMFGLTDKQRVSVEVPGSRITVYRDVLVRVRGSFRWRVHLDMDEANAAGMDGFTLGRLIVD